MEVALKLAHVLSCTVPSISVQDGLARVFGTAVRYDAALYPRTVSLFFCMYSIDVTPAVSQELVSYLPFGKVNMQRV